MNYETEIVNPEEFFQQNGFYPTVYKAPKPRSNEFPRSTPKPGRFGPALALRGWRAPLHWAVPPAFEKPGLVYQTIGHEAFCEQVRSYYEAIRDIHVDRAQRAHVKWAIRALLRTFETHVRGFRRQEVGRKGSLFVTASDVVQLPETLVAEGRLMADLKDYLRAYAVPREKWPLTERLVKARLTQLWGVKC